MGYERNDGRYGGDRDRNERNYGSGNYDNRDQGFYGRSGGDRDRGYDRDRNDGGRSYGSGDRYRESNHRSSRDDDDRGFFERAGDEVRSWFGDEEAERRRRNDDRESGGGYGGHEERSRYGSDRSRQSGGYYGGGSYQADQDTGFGSSYGSNSRYGQARSGQSSRSDHDPHYTNWRDRQVQSLDRDYDEYRQHNQSRFENEFASWRQTRQTQRDTVKQVREHQEVVGSDGEHLGVVDHVRGDKILLTKNDQNAGGHHHTIPSLWIDRIEDDKVKINKTASEAKRQWTEADEDNQSGSGGGGLFGRGNDDGERLGQQRNLNRSFSGTY